MLLCCCSCFVRRWRQLTLYTLSCSGLNFTLAVVLCCVGASSSTVIVIIRQSRLLRQAFLAMCGGLMQARLGL